MSIKVRNQPEDRTIGAAFEFCVFSRRWNHEDRYTITRTENGWTIAHMAIGGHCDKGGRPFLFENFRQDSIRFPAGIDFLMESLWNEAASKGLSKEQVQAELQHIADLVTKTEQNGSARGA